MNPEPGGNTLIGDKLGHAAFGSPGAEVTSLVRAEHAKYALAVRDAKLSPQ